jgi:hypothetical protein
VTNLPQSACAPCRLDGSPAVLLAASARGAWLSLPERPPRNPRARLEVAPGRSARVRVVTVRDGPEGFLAGVEFVEPLPGGLDAFLGAP